MSCSINLIAGVKNVSVLKKFLDPSNSNLASTDELEDEEVGWKDDDWGWGTEDSTKDCNSDDTNAVDEWLSSCEIAVSSLGDLVILSKGDKLAVLQANYENSEGELLEILWKGTVSEFPREEITAVKCLPLVSYKQSSQGTPEWNCLVVGFNTGHVRMYTETGTKVLDQMLHNQSVMNIKCKTYSHPRYPGSSDLTEELIILYDTVLVTIDGFSLFQTLRACKNRAASEAAGSLRQIDVQPLCYKKWGLKGQGQSYDHCSGGSYTPNPFDQMQAASLAGFRERLSAVPPTTNIYGVSGENPVMGLYFIKEDEGARMFYNVTDAATKLFSVGASALMSWGSNLLGKKPQTTEKAQQKIEPATYVSARYQIFDKRRVAQTLNASPFGGVAVVTDSLGRVLLVDIHRGTIKRVWKGYRNAEVGWISVKESKKSHSSAARHALFLVIYAPKRGLLEIWLANNGTRVGAFNVGKDCRLIYPGCTLLGLNSSTHRYVRDKLAQCYLLTSKGNLMSINIPFHLCLGDSNSKRAHDQQLLNTMRSILHDYHEDNEEIADLVWQPLSKLKLISSFQLGLDKILNVPFITPLTAAKVIEKIVNHIKYLARKQQQQQIMNSANPEDEFRSPDLDVESRLLLDYCLQKKHIIELYQQLIAYHQKPSDEEVVEPVEIQPVSEMEFVLGIKTPSYGNKKVVFDTGLSVIGLCDLLSLVNCGTQHKATLKKLNGEQSAQIGELIYKPCLEFSIPPSAIFEVISPLSIDPRALLNLFLDFYLSQICPPDDNLSKLHRIMENLYQLDKQLPTDIDETRIKSEPGTPATPEMGDFSPAPSYFDSKPPLPTVRVGFWSYVRDVCEATHYLRSYLHIAIVSRSLCLKLTDQISLDEEKETDSDQVGEKISNSEPTVDELSASKTSVKEWEHLSVDVTLWNICIKHIEDVSLLNNVLQWRPNTGDGAKKSSPCTFVTVKDFKLAKRGFVAELIGRWCVQNRMSAADLEQHLEVTSSEGNNKDDPLAHLRVAFPLSLTNDAIFANAAWEYLSHWNKDVESLTNFKIATEYLIKINDSCIRHGICWMMWKVYLVRRFSSLVALIDKVGKAPKDRLCKKEMDMDTAAATEFTCLFNEYLSVFLEANCDYSETRLVLCEPHWEEFLSGHSLLEMANQQRETNYQLLSHHASLTAIVCCIMVFSMKSVKVRALFDDNGSAAFFKELDSHPYLGYENKNEIVASNRKSFLCRILRHCVQSLPEKSKTIAPDGSIIVDRSHVGVRWPEHVLDLGKKFDLNLDQLKQFHVKELISHGYDQLAIQLLPTITDSTTLYSEVLELCAQRISYILRKAEQEETANVTSSASPFLLDWLSDKDHSQLVEPGAPVSDTNKLLLHAVRGLKSSPANYKYANELYNLTVNIN